MKNLEELKVLLELANEFKSDKVDKNLEEGVKKTTEELLEANPNISFDDIVNQLLMSARKSFSRMMESKDIISASDRFLELVEDRTVNEEIILKHYIRLSLVFGLLHNYFLISYQVASEVWNGRKGTE